MHSIAWRGAGLALWRDPLDAAPRAIGAVGGGGSACAVMPTVDPTSESGVRFFSSGPCLSLFLPLGEVAVQWSSRGDGGRFRSCWCARRSRWSPMGSCFSASSSSVGRLVRGFARGRLLRCCISLARPPGFWGPMVTVLDRRLRALSSAPPFRFRVGGRLGLPSGHLLSSACRGRLLVGASIGGGTQDGSATSLSIEQTSELESSRTSETVLVSSSSSESSPVELSSNGRASSLP